jgi:hypothetical protein
VFVGGASFSFGRVLKNFGSHLEFGGAQRLDWCSLEVFRSIGCACVHIPTFASFNFWSVLGGAFGALEEF